MEDSRLNAIECLKLITFVKGRPNFSCKSTTAANIDLTESLLDNWLKNNHNTVEKNILPSQSVCIFLTNFSFQIYFSTAENRHRILWQPEGISQSNGSIGHPLGFVIDRLNTSASLYRIARCLIGIRHPCYDQLTPVKTRYPLTSITWPYRGLKLTAHRDQVFLKLTTDQLLVFRLDRGLMSG